MRTSTNDDDDYDAWLAARKRRKEAKARRTVVIVASVSIGVLVGLGTLLWPRSPRLAATVSGLVPRPGVGGMVRSGSVAVTLQAVEVGPIHFEDVRNWDGTVRRSARPLLTCILKVVNLDPTRKIDLSSWCHPKFQAIDQPALTPQLRDNFGNVYKLAFGVLQKPAEVLLNVRLDSRPHIDRVAFDLPLPAATSIDLTLPSDYLQPAPLSNFTFRSSRKEWRTVVLD